MRENYVNFVVLKTNRIMATLDIRVELKKMIDQEVNDNVLEAIKTLLSKSTLDKTLKDKLSSRALKSEEDIQNGNVYSLAEMKAKTEQYLNR